MVTTKLTHIQQIALRIVADLGIVSVRLIIARNPSIIAHEASLALTDLRRMQLLQDTGKRCAHVRIFKPTMYTRQALADSQELS